MEKLDKEMASIYIPEAHRSYDLLPNCKKNNFEMIVWDHELLNKIKKLTNMPDHMLYPNQHYKSYKNFFDEMDRWINSLPNAKQEIEEYKNSVIKMNNKDLWAIVQYIGESNWSFTKDKYYYVVMYKENTSWVIEGIIDNEEYSAFISWSPSCTEPLDLVKDLKIIIDPSNNLENEFIRIMKDLRNEN